MRKIEYDDLEIRITVDDVETVNLTCGNGLEGFICEPDGPKHVRMEPSDILEVVKWLTEVAADRCRDYEDKL